MSNDRVNPPLPRTPSTTPTVRGHPSPRPSAPGRPAAHFRAPALRGTRTSTSSAFSPRPSPVQIPTLPETPLGSPAPFLLAACMPLKVDPFPEPLRPPIDVPADAVAPEVTEPRTELQLLPTPASSSRNPWPKVQRTT